MQSMLNSCGSFQAEVMLAVMWGELSILEEVLMRQPAEERSGLSRGVVARHVGMLYRVQLG